ncbi:galactosylceramide sulfotransferase-like isoform X2 [Ptychodera flava]|uniref:galactosylceramide sulfotransferase-like isoform X2 n=1 Tax=Ptychodera flava TaxID=63121 RepID=UPI00396A2017
MLTANRNRSLANRKIFFGVTGCLSLFYIASYVYSTLSYPNISAVFQAAEFSSFPGLKRALSETSSNSTCFGSYDVAYLFNRKTGSTTLVTLLHRAGRKYGYTLKREIAFHNSEAYSGLMNFFHLDGVNHPSALQDTGNKKTMSIHKRNGVLLPNQVNMLQVNRGSIESHPKSIETMFVSIVRDPASNFRSVFNFFDISKKYMNDKNGDFGMFLSDPGHYRQRMPSGSLAWAITRNSQTWHFGLHHVYHDKKDVVDRYIDQMEREIDLVIVNEYYDESLILLKRLLCWKMEDILYLARRVSDKHETLTSDSRAKIYRWNSADVRLYERFNRTLWRKIHDYGDGFEKELNLFRALKKSVTEDCERFNSLRKETIDYLSRQGTYIKDGRLYCKHVAAWFSFETDIAYKVIGPGEFEVKPTGPGKKYLSTKHIQKPLVEELGATCLKVTYREYSWWFGWPMRALDVYVGIGDEGLLEHPKTMAHRGKYSAMFEIDTSKSNVQVTSEARYSDEDYVISDVSLHPGTCGTGR